LAQAISIAQTGDDIEVAGATSPGGSGGWYGCEAISNSSKTLTISAATGQYPWFTCDPLMDYGSGTYGAYALAFNNVDNITMNGIYIDGVWWENGNNNWTWNNVHISCLNGDSHFPQWQGYCNAKIDAWELNDLNNFTMNGGEIGPSVDDDPGTYPGNSKFAADNAVFDGVTFHDNTNLGGHSECFFLRGGWGVTFRNNWFKNCAVMAVFVSCYPTNVPTDTVCLYSGHAPDNVLFENNFVGVAPYGNYYSIQVRDTNPALTMNLRYNTMDLGVLYGPASGEAVGNIMGYDGCSGNYTYSYNVFGDDSGRKCGGATNSTVLGTINELNASRSDGAGYNLTTGQLNAGSVAENAGDPGDYPATDHEGTVRTSPPDAGWDER